MLRIVATRRLGVTSSRTTYVQIQQKRSFFGLGQILGVIANPAETIRQLNESRDLLKKAKEDIELSNEQKKIPKKHTFSRLPGFHGREEEQALLRKILANIPKLSVVFGATSVGKTALLREVLATDDFYVIKFDLRISGFADLRTLYIALCEQFERFFEEMHDEEMDKQKLTFKHLNLEITEREKPENGGHEVSVADLASLMESLQSALLNYWEYDPKAKLKEKNGDKDKSDSSSKDESIKSRAIDSESESKDDVSQEKSDDKGEAEEEKLFKKRPLVFLMDEAHKLPALVDDQLSLKVFLDTLLVLTKQDRLCHVILSTSDSFFQHFLRSMNVGHHAQILTVGDCCKEDTYSYFRTELLPTVPDELKSKIDFEEIFEAFGGKLSHISDYLSAWVNADGKLTPLTSAIFIQAYTLLQFHLIHEKFETFSPLSTATSGTSTDNDDAKYDREDLVHVMRKVTQPPYSLPYFQLCREIGTPQVDSMIKTRVLDLRWTKTITPEQDWIERKWSEDGIERPIVLPMTRIVRKAMEVALQEEDRMEKIETDSPRKKQKNKKTKKDKKDDDDSDDD